MNDDPTSNGHPALRPSATRARSEPELQTMIVEALRASGIAVEEQLVCNAGMADIVTARRDAVIEVKLDLNRKQIQWAVGQVLLYRQAINPNARAIVVGYAANETAGLVDWVAAIGAEVVCWGVEAGGWKLAGDPLQLLIANPQPLTLQWNVQSLALSHGITRVADLARFLGLPRAGLYGVWRGTAANISVARLERLAVGLALEPTQPLDAGDWFRWNQSGHMIWAVKLVAEQVGLDTAQLAFRAGLYPQQMAAFYDGDAQFVFVDTLARMAAALETEARPFHVGELFVRAES